MTDWEHKQAHANTEPPTQPTRTVWGKTSEQFLCTL